MKYNELMDKIEVTPEMRQRVLENVQAARERKRKRAMIRQIVSLAACLAIVLCCWFAWQPKQEEQNVQMIPQIEDVDSVEALAEKTGVPIRDLTGLPFTVTQRVYTVYWEELAQIVYEGTDNSLCYRKSLGTEDNSGDYNTYDLEEALTVSGCTVTLKGNSDGYSLATWTDGTYAYSVSFTEALPAETVRSLLESNF